MIDEVYKHLASAVAQSEQCDSCKSKCDEKPLLTESDRGRDIAFMTGSMSGMELISDVNSAVYKATCWIIHDDPMQIESSNSAIVQRYALALLYYTTNGPNWNNKHNFLGPFSECEWCNMLNQGVFCNEDGNVKEIKLRKLNNEILILHLFILNYSLSC